MTSLFSGLWRRCCGFVEVALLVGCMGLPRPVQGSGVIGSGSAASCTDVGQYQVEHRLDQAIESGGVVTFNCGDTPVTITVSHTKNIRLDTTIDGGGLVTLSGGDAVGVLAVSRGVALNLTNITIANGRASWGGGIYNWSGNVTLTNVTVANCTPPYGRGDLQGGAIYNEEGSITVTNSTFSGNRANTTGGAILNGGTMWVSNTTFFDNSAHYFDSTNYFGGGGAIANSMGTLTVTNSTFFRNRAYHSGAASDYANGGAIMNDRGTVTVTSSTFSGNSADAQGGGVYNGGGIVTVTNTIIANSDGGNCAGHPITDGGHNLQFPGTDCGVGIPEANPLLDPHGLGDNGGPTQTIALLSGSPAADAGDDVVCAAPPVENRDQRGVSRPGTGHTHCSIGAFELVIPPTPTISPTSTLTPTVTPTPQVVHINIASPKEAVAPGGSVKVTVSLATSGAHVAATGNDIVFDAQALAIQPSSCRLNHAIPKSLVASSVRAGTVRIFVQSSTNSSSIQEGPLYVCTAYVLPSTLPGVYPLALDNLMAFGPTGAGVSPILGTNASIEVSLVGRVCIGDCDGDGSVTVDELVTGVNMALGSLPVGQCLMCDRDGTGAITVDELATAVNNALYGCPTFHAAENN